MASAYTPTLYARYQTATILHRVRPACSFHAQSWNKFCFTGGIVEVSASLPGDAHIGGLWPAIWLLGNLARATYTASSDYQWPWSYSRCDREEHPDYQSQQEISACNVLNHYGMKPGKGRGAPEIDILEVRLCRSRADGIAPVEQAPSTVGLR